MAQQITVALCLIILRCALRVEEETLRRELANVSSLTSQMSWLSSRLPKISSWITEDNKEKPLHFQA
ncbi:olfactory receptor [Sarotherodon galilaeus]